VTDILVMILITMRIKEFLKEFSPLQDRCRIGAIVGILRDQPFALSESSCC